MSYAQQGFLHVRSRVYGVAMVTVYYLARTPDHPWDVRKFHRTADCHELTKPRAQGVAHELLEADLADLTKVLPCRCCYPDAPRIKRARTRCMQCNTGSARACPHNGGVPVIIMVNRLKYTPYMKPGDQWTKTIYVWPDRVHLHYNLE